MVCIKEKKIVDNYITRDGKIYLAHKDAKQTPRTLVPTPKRKHGVPPNVDIGHYIKLYYPGSRYHFGYPKCDVCNRATQEQYAVGEHRFCNFGCIVIYMDRIGGTAHNLLFDLAYLMEKGWSRRSMREVVLG